MRVDAFRISGNFEGRELASCCLSKRSKFQSAEKPYDPQTNGAVESAVKNVKQSLRANLLTLERRLQARVPASHPIVSWLVRHSTMLRMVRMRGRDGKTGFERARGTQCSSKLLGFGEMCRYKCRSREGAIAGMVQRFSVRVWLGLELRI